MYIAARDTAQVYELYSVPIDGGTGAVELNDPFLDPNFDVSEFVISSDGRRVAFVVERLYSADIDGQGPTIHLFDSSVHNLGMSPDGLHVVFGKDRTGSGIYSVPIDGSSSAVQLLASFETTYLISPAGDRVIGGFTRSIRSVPIAGGPETVLAGPYPLGRGIGHPFSAGGRPVRFTPDGSRIVFISDHETDDLFELYSVLADGSGPIVKLSESPTEVCQFELSPDSSRVVYRALPGSGHFELFSVPTAGGPSVKINAPLVAGGNIGDVQDQSFFVISPDSQRVAYRADQEINDIFELFGVPIDGGPVLRLNESFVGPNRDVSFGLLVFRDVVVYSSDQAVSGKEELFAVGFDGSPESRRLCGAMIPTGDVPCCLNRGFRPFAITADGAFVVYRADQDTDAVNELYASRFFPSHRPQGAAVR